MKTKLNDYSAFQNLFRDGVLSILIGSGLLNTIVPNAIEYLGQVKSLSSFDALNLFSVVYFVFPVLILTTYWFLRGSRLFFMEKLTPDQTTQYRSRSRLTTRYNWLKWIVVFAKVVPIVFFIRDESFFMNTALLACLGFWYAAVCLTQLIINTRTHRTALEHANMNVEHKLKISLLYQVFCVDSLILFLDFIVGITLIVFSMPWIIYDQLFYPACALFICTYALCNWCYSVNAFREYKLRIEDFIVAVLVCACGLSFPSLNFTYYGHAAILVAGGFAGVTLWWYWQNRTTMKRIPWNTLVPSALIFVSVVLISHYMVHKGLTKLNYAYMKHRVDASNHIHVSDSLPASAGMNKSLRQFYYGRYLALHDPEVFRRYNNQDSINNFYQAVFRHILKVRPELNHQVSLVTDVREREHLQPFLHPLDFTANRLQQLSENLTDLDTLLRICEVLSAVLPDTAAYTSFHEWPELQARLVSEMKRLDEKIAVDSIDKTSARYRSIRDLTALLYSEAYQDAQHIYRSYLTDTQRIGVWSFIVCVLILATATIINNLDLYPQHSSEKKKGSGTGAPIDTPRNALLIQCLAILILLVPLAKHIEPENIDPEQPYWMMSLQNWYAPTFFKSIAKDTPERYSPSDRTIVNNTIDLSKLEVALREIVLLRQDQQHLMLKLDSTASELNRTLMKFDTYDETRVLRSRAKPSSK